MAHRPFTRRQARQNQAWLEALRQTGNPRLAARLLGVHRSTYTKRRAKSAAFAQGWDAALAAAHAAFHEAGGASAPDQAPLPTGERRGRGAKRERQPQSLRTRGGELHVGRTRGGRLQLRRAPPGWMTKAGEQTFFRALSATANVRLSAAAAGFSHTAFYAKQRLRPAFAREMRLSLRMGYDRVEEAAILSALPESFEDDAWRHNEPPAIPPMTPGQAFQLLYLHHKTVRLDWDRPHRRRRRNEPWEAYRERMRAMWMAEQRHLADAAALRRAARYQQTGDWRFEDEATDQPALPALEQVKAALEQRARSERDGACRPTGPQSGTRSTARDNGSVTHSKAVHNPDLALFGGWRLEDWEKRKRSRK